MGIAADIAEDWHASLAALGWQVEAGVDEVLSETPVNRYDLPAEAPRVAPAAVAAAPARRAEPAPVGSEPAVDAVAEATRAAAGARDLDELRAAITGFAHCEVKKGARTTVFADGNPAARVLVLGEAPGRDEDQEGRPFVGRAGALLDRMFAAIGLSRGSPDPETALYLTCAMPWRPLGDPRPPDIAMMTPFVQRHIQLVDPAVIVVMGNTPLICLTGQRGLQRARGTWTTVLGRPMLPMFHPDHLIRNPAAKREAWADLLALQARLRG